MQERELCDLKEFISSQVNLKRSKDFRFWGGIIVFLLVVIFWGSVINMKQGIEDTKFKTDPKTYSWDHVFMIFKEKYDYEKSLFADVESENIVLKSMIDDIYYIFHKDELFLSYFQKAEIIRRDLERRRNCPEE
jgi:hypothetical protein